jgi:hypothetical protein
MGDGKLSSFSMQEKIANQALRLEVIPKVSKALLYQADKLFLIIERDLRSSIALNVSIEQINKG